jgi:taurine dioxygenase
MISIKPVDAILGAIVEDVDLAAPLDEATFNTLVTSLGEYGVLRFPKQDLTPTQLRDFSRRFGSLEISVPEAQEPGVPEVSILSNIIENGRRIGLADAGQTWHTDMSYRSVIGFVNILFALQVPVRDGKPLGATSFVNTQAACAQLPDELRKKLQGRSATHHLGKYWDSIRAKGSQRRALTEEEKARTPPVSHPVLLRHPVTTREVLYVNPSFTVGIDGLEQAQSDQLLQALFDHMLQEKYRYTNQWQSRDVLIWDNIGTWHMAIADYGLAEPRLMKRCQVAADKIFKRVA